MAGKKDGKLRLDAAVLIKSYPTFKSLPKPMKDYNDRQNAPIIARNKIKEAWNLLNPNNKQELEKLNTTCVYQLSWALNAVGGEHSLPQMSPRPRNNVNLEGRFHMGAVDELENYLNDQYGDGEVVKTPKRSSQKAMEAYLNGRQGILAFREGYAGAHCEIWDKTRVLQNGAPIGNNTSGVAVMDAKWMWGRPKIIFWEILPPKPAFIAPPWLLGWWEVTDLTNKYYYYFFPDGSVFYTRTAPTFNYCPVPKPMSMGSYTLPPPTGIRIKWADEDYAAELFTFAVSYPVLAMAGTYEGIAALPFAAVKMKFRFM